MIENVETLNIKVYHLGGLTPSVITTFLVGTSIFYPNSCSDILYLNAPISEKPSFTIFDLNGRTAHRGQVEGGDQTIHLDFQGKGVYWIQLGELNQKIIKL